MGDSSAAAAEVKKVADMRPGTSGHNLNVKVLKTMLVVDRPPRGPRGQPLRVAEAIVGDESASILLSARNEQLELVQPGKYVALRGAKVEMYRGSMRLAVAASGAVEALDGASFKPNEAVNLSLIDWELVLLPGPDAKAKAAAGAGEAAAADEGAADDGSGEVAAAAAAAAAAAGGTEAAAAGEVAA